MTSDDSPIIDFYPETFQIDMNGKKMVWQGVALLPFIDEKRLLDAMAEPYKDITEDEKRRNSWGADNLWIGQDHPLCPLFESLYGKKAPELVSFVPLVFGYICLLTTVPSLCRWILS